ncbi:MAG: hypothetical protein N3F66_15280, partial [Spirochaetes bacterium]|nr:hypothetical protein [Spirochaetota bacterium]
MFFIGSISIPVFVLFIAGIFLYFKKDFSLTSFVVLLPIICFCIIYTIFWSQIRYRIPIEPYVI